MVEFFRSTLNNAIKVAETGPGFDFPTYSCGNFDVEDALLRWESAISGESFMDLVGKGLPEVVVEDDTGPVVLVVSDTIVAWLSGANISKLNWLAEAWAGSGGRVKVRSDIAVGIFRGIRDLARENGADDTRIYCWSSG